MKTNYLSLGVLTLAVLYSSAQNNSTNPPVTLGLLPVISFLENPVNHNMHIASDGNFYYTINGGSSSGQVGKFTLAGVLVQNYSVPIDGRGLSYNFADGFLYASTYAGNVVRINDLATGSVTTVFPGIMQNSQASFAISPDGSKFYDFNMGNLEIHDFLTGTLLNTITGLSYGTGNYGGEAAVAVSATNIFTWNSAIKTVYAYDLSGNFVQSTVIDSGDNGHSLAIANGYLFVSKDGNYATGTWYGYNLAPIVTSIPSPGNITDLTIYPNPSSGKIIIPVKADAIEIFNETGAKIMSLAGLHKDSQELDLSGFGAGIYFVTVKSGSTEVTKKIVIR